MYRVRAELPNDGFSVISHATAAAALSRFLSFGKRGQKSQLRMPIPLDFTRPASLAAEEVKELEGWNCSAHGAKAMHKRIKKLAVRPVFALNHRLRFRCKSAVRKLISRSGDGRRKSGQKGGGATVSGAFSTAQTRSDETLGPAP
jgi:hypothetical protein